MQEEENQEIEQKEKKKKEKSLLGEIWEWTYCIVLAVVIALLIKNLLFSSTIVKKTSMLQTLQENDILLVNRFAQVTGKPLERGDIVIIEAPEYVLGNKFAVYEEDNLLSKFGKLLKKELYVKRVIGLPGEVIKIDGNEVSINGEILDEPYINPDNPAKGHSRDQEVDIPEGYIFCIGDNRGSSLDSRDFGLIPINKVEGTTSFRAWPLNRFGKVE